MKRFAILLAVVSFVLFIPVYSFGAIYYFGDLYATTDTFYTITPEQPYIEAHYEDFDYATPRSILGFEYYQNDQTFVNFNSYTQGIDTKLYLDGSYLAGFGLFAGLEIYSHTYPGYSIQEIKISPGYRWALDDQSYVAISVDYNSTETIKDIVDFAINARYYNDNMKVFGNLKFYTNPSYGNNSIGFGAHYKVNEYLVVGASLSNITTNTLNTLLTGGTYQSDMVIIDGQMSINNPAFGGSNQIYLSGMFLLGDSFKVGAEYGKNTMIENAELTLKAKMEMEKSSFTLKYTPKNDSFVSSMSLAYQQTL